MNPTQSPDPSGIIYSPISSLSNINALTSANNPVSNPATQDSSNPTTNTVQPEHKGNWFTHLLPTIGGIGGSILGGLATAGLGGEVVGGAGGGALGKMLENSLEGQKVVQGNDVTSAIENGAGTAVGGAIGKGLGAIGSMLGRRAASTVADTAVKSGVDDNLANAQVLNALYGTSKSGVGNAAEVAAKTGLDMTNPAALQQAGQFLKENTGAVMGDTLKTIPVNISGVVDQSGNKVLPSIDDLIHSSITNTNPINGDLLGSSRSTILGGLGPGQTDQDLLNNGYTKFLGSSSKTGANTDATKLLDEMHQLVSGVNTGATANADDLLKTQQMVGQRAYSLSKIAAKPSATDVDQAKADTMNTFNNELQKMIFQHPDVQAAAQNAVGNMPASEFGGNQALADFFNNHVTNMQSGDELNKLFSHGYSLENVGKDGLDVINNPASSGNLKLAQLAAHNSNDANPSLINSVASNAHHGLKGMALAAMNHTINNPNVLDTLSRIGGLSDKLGTIAGRPVAGAADLAGTAVIGGLPNFAAAPVSVDPAASGTINTNQNGTSMQPDPNSQQEMINAMRAQSILAPFMAGQSGATSYMQSIAPMLQRNQLTETALAGLPQSFANAGGAQGMSGILSRLNGLIPGTAANVYQKQQSGAAQALASQLGISPEAAMGLLPQLMQNQATAGQNQSVLGQLQGQLAY